VKIQQLDEMDGRRAFALVCDRGDDPVEALTAAAKRLDLSAASLTGIVASSAVTLGFFDRPGATTHAGSSGSRSRWCR
jgi:predicted DNA-binding protein with PD1-like motif